ncbi:helix-turn-helix domain-containing protein [Streptomyces sp. NPDC055105]|uniref:helix-turn-helix domain-containing protein n=1 Tax=Streptomyces sp. NPDC055105 TaxID=3365719 RepID=UPI0037D21EB5
MALSLDLDKPFRSPLELKELINAIYAAGDHDENDWIEWKSTYDLTQKEVKATLARHIIAMANRMPDKSVLTASGYGYIVVGVEPGNVTGLATIDLADLESGIRPYLGHRGPEWNPSYAKFDEKDVLVISIAPPKAGDAIFTLHKDFAKYSAGMIFVRRAAQTVQAGPGEVAQLAARTHKSDSRQALMVSSPSSPVLVPAWPWLDERVTLLAGEEHSEVERRSGSRGNQGGLAGFVQNNRDPRTDSEYATEIEIYLSRYTDYLYSAAYWTYVRDQMGALQIRIRNTEERSYQKVRIEIEIPRTLKVLSSEDHENEPTAPTKPRPRGDQFAMSGGFSSFGGMTIAGREPSIHLRVEEDKIIGDVRVIRAEEEVAFPVVHLLLPQIPPADEILDMPWSMTAVDAVGRTRGTIRVSQDGELIPGAGASGSPAGY